MNSKKIVLFNNKSDCCGCSACMNICPKKAISMKQDECGFEYPVIKEELCIKCGACKKVCFYQMRIDGNNPQKVFVAANRSKRQLLNSASGGIFAALATKILNEGGIVFGATLLFENDHANPHHICIKREEDIIKLQGSKYVQSSIGTCYQEAESYLKQGITVLFSGTPCQVAGLKGYLCNTYDNLITMDLICHGVPNARIFNDYLQIEKQKLKADKIIGYLFRDKRKGWGMNGCINYITNKERVKSKFVPARLASYNTLFLDACIYRENCYSCKYAGKKRYSDLTVGDYWGIEKEHPELLGTNGYEEKWGISCVLANTVTGATLCDEMKDFVMMNLSTFDKVKNKNGQLRSPSKKPDEYYKIMDLYRKQGYAAIELYFRRKYRKQIIIHTIYNIFPRMIRTRLKKILT